MLKNMMKSAALHFRTPQVAIACLATVGLASAEDLVFDFAAHISGTSSETVSGLGVDSSGNTYLTGFFNGTTDFDPGVGTSNVASLGFSDVFFCKLDSAGDLVWVKIVGSTADERPYDIAVDSSGNVYTAGTFQGTVDFDPGAGVTNLTSVGSLSIFVQKLDSSGDLVWAKTMTGTGFGVPTSI